MVNYNLAGSGHVRAYTPGVLKKQLRDHGFRIVLHKGNWVPFIPQHFVNDIDVPWLAITGECFQVWQWTSLCLLSGSGAQRKTLMCTGSSPRFEANGSERWFPPYRLACDLVDRQLVICDSFAGLPKPSERARTTWARRIAGVEAPSPSSRVRVAALSEPVGAHHTRFRRERTLKTLIVVLNWNSREMTEQCIHSLLAMKGDSFHILVVDNGSRDGSAEYLQEIFPTSRVIANGRNLGFAAGCNIGMRRALKMGGYVRAGQQ